MVWTPRGGEQILDPPSQQQQPTEHQEVSIYYPGKIGLSEVKVLLNRRKGNVLVRSEILRISRCRLRYSHCLSSNVGRFHFRFKVGRLTGVGELQICRVGR
jgi:hypothetical protein